MAQPRDAVSGSPLRNHSPKRLSVCLINPRFEPSFWGFEFALPLMPGDKRSWVVTGALPALAALCPPNCEVNLVDENVEEIDFAKLAKFDVIGVTGMVVQQRRMREILLQLRGSSALVVVGGPYVSVAEQVFEDLCDVRFIGEAEETWPEFLNALSRSEPVQSRYEQAHRTDMENVPAPRYDLVKAPRYMMASLQFSRGCPFRCEFCDIITIFGRKPRLKTVAQMLSEFDAIASAGFRACFLVDDNFIGNRVRAKELLKALVDWQRRHRYPLSLFTEVSINLAEDDELIEMMVAANFRQVFIGIESPRMASLQETLKQQNIRGVSLRDKVQRIRDGGLVVQAGFIVGFDNDDPSIFDEQFSFIQEAGIANAMVSVLSPTPTTPLFDRLQVEGRLDFSDPEVIFHPKGMTREVLKSSHRDLTRRLYEPNAYFERLFRGYSSSPAFRQRRAAQDALSTPPRIAAAHLRATMAGLTQALRLARAAARARLLRKLCGAYVAAWFRYNRPLGREAVPFCAFVSVCVTHWHLYNVSRSYSVENFGSIRKWNFSLARSRPKLADGRQMLARSA